MIFRKTVVFLIALVLLSFSSVTAQKDVQLPKVKFKEYKLKNGLRVVLHEDKSTPDRRRKRLVSRRFKE